MRSIFSRRARQRMRLHAAIAIFAAAATAMAAWPAPAWAEDEAEVNDANANGAEAVDAEEADQPEIAVDEEAEALVADGERLEIIVEAVQGLVQVREGEEADWQRAEPGMELPIGAELRTGPRSIVRFRVGPTQVITLDRLGTVQVLEAIEREGLVDTDIGMPYGRTRYEVQAVEDIEHSGRIRSPSATLAVSGSEGFLEDYADRPPFAGSDAGDIAFVNVRGQHVNLDPPSRIEDDQTAGAEYQLAEGTANPLGQSLDDLEYKLMGTYPAGPFHLQLIGFDAFHAHDSAAASFAAFAERRDDVEPPPEVFAGSLTFETVYPQFENPPVLFEVATGTGETLTSGEGGMTESGGIMIDQSGDGFAFFQAGWLEGVPMTDFTATLSSAEGGASINFFRGELLDGTGEPIADLQVSNFFVGAEGSQPPPGVMTIDLTDDPPGFDYSGWTSD